MADPIHGTWQIERPDGAVMTLALSPGATEAEHVCGLVQAVDGDANNEEVGTQFISDMAPQGGGRYDDGTLFIVPLNRSIGAEITLASNNTQAEVRGCILLVCQTVQMQRLP
ncbi:MAG: DUF2147 domain-containing protein [Pseudomonadota bacterium]